MKNLANYLVQHGLRTALSLMALLVALGHSTGMLSIGALQKIDNSIYDAKLRWSMPQTLDSRIVIVDIDEKSMAELGQWPWNRQKLAHLTNELVQTQKVAMIGFDTVFSQADDSSGLTFIKQLTSNSSNLDAIFLSQLANLQPTLDYDAQFALSMKDQKVVLGFYFNNDRVARTLGQLPKAYLEEGYITNHKNRLPEWRGFASNLQVLANATPYAGFLNVKVDDDGVLRSGMLLSAYKTDLHASLALAMYQLRIEQLNTQGKEAGKTATATTAAAVATHNTDLKHSVNNSANHFAYKVKSTEQYIPFRGLGGPNGGSFQYVSAADVLSKKIPTRALYNKIVLIGSSTSGFQDLHLTPVGKDYPAVEMQANMLSGLLDDRILHKPHEAMATDVGLLVFAALLLLLTLPWLSASHAFLLCAFVLAVPLVLHAYLFHALGMVLPFAAFLFLVVANYVLNLSYRHISESKAKRDLASLLGSYVPGQLVDKLLQDADSHTMKATNKDMTVMFCDLRGFTQLGQDIPPIKLQHLLNDVFSRLSRIILLHQGTVDKYMGDCIMAFWGAPDELPSHAEQAVSAALAIIREVKKINLEHQAKFLPIVRLGIGINTGVMCVGDMGSSIRRSYTVVGDAVNTAARLESLTKTHQLDLLVGLSTKLAAPMFYWVLIDTVLLAGKANKLAIFTVNQHAKVLK